MSNQLISNQSDRSLSALKLLWDFVSQLVADTPSNYQRQRQWGLLWGKRIVHNTNRIPGKRIKTPTSPSVSISYSRAFIHSKWTKFKSPTAHKNTHHCQISTEKADKQTTVYISTTTKKNNNNAFIQHYLLPCLDLGHQHVQLRRGCLQEASIQWQHLWQTQFFGWVKLRYQFAIYIEMGFSSFIVAFVLLAEYDNAKAITAMCEIALEACQSWFPQGESK